MTNAAVAPTATPVSSELAVDRDNPWPGLGAFSETARSYFNGRDRESAALLRLVSQEQLTVLFGASGLGKTSLLQAGLFPKIRQQMLPVYVRLNFDQVTNPLIEQVQAALEAEVEKHGVDAPSVRSGESLWAYLHRSGLEFWSKQNRLLIPLFVFDQFEEVVTLGAAVPQSIAQFRTDLANLIENRVPAALTSSHSEGDRAELSLDNRGYKILLSFREDFLPALEEWKRDIPSILRNRLRLLPMSEDEAFRAVHNTAPHLAPEPIARKIVSFVADAGSGSGETTGGETIEPAVLSLLCAGLNERRKKQNKTQIDEELLAGAGKEILAEYYERAVEGMPNRVKRFIEEELITERGFRKPCYRDDARSLHRITDEEITKLVNRRLVRIEPAGRTEKIELIHDVIAPIVKRQRDVDRRWNHRVAILRAAVFSLVVLIILAVAIITTRLYMRTEAALAAERKANASQQRTAGLAKKFQDAQRVLTLYLTAVSSQHESDAEELAADLRAQGQKNIADRLDHLYDQDATDDPAIERLRTEYLNAMAEATKEWYAIQKDISDARGVFLPKASASPLGTPRFAQPSLTPDPDKYETRHVSDTLAYQILQSVPISPLPFPLYPSAEPILKLSQILGSRGPVLEEALAKSGKITFQAVGSTGNLKSPSHQVRVADAMLQQFALPLEARPAFFLHLGDIVFNFGESEYYFDQFYAPYRNYPAPILALAGNHEGAVVPGSTASSLQAFLSNFCANAYEHRPEAGTSVRTAQIEPGVYFTLEAPFIRILALYSNVLESVGVISSENGKYPYLADAQLNFLKAALTRIKREGFKGAVVLAVHHPPYVFNSRAAGLTMLREIDAVCRSVGIWPHAVLSGHAMNYERFTRTLDGRETPFIIAGTGGHGIAKLLRRDQKAPTLPALKPELSNGSDVVALEKYNDMDFGYLSVSADAARLTIAFQTASEKSAGQYDSVSVDLNSRKVLK